MSNTQDLLTILQCRHPLIQAPMAGVATPRLAAAVSGAGGLGSLGLGASSIDQARTAILDARTLGAASLHVNVFCHRPARASALVETAWLAHLKPFFEALGAPLPEALSAPYGSFAEQSELLDLLCALRPTVVSFHFGLPTRSALASLRSAGIATLACVTTLDEARQAQALGVDALIAQGAEAGGHRGCFDPADDTLLGTFALLRQLVGAVNLPIVAAGGIMDGAGIAAATRLGAAAVQMGTAFLLCPESAADAAYRAALRSPAAYRTSITDAISGRPARGLENRMHREIGTRSAPTRPDYPIAYSAGKALAAAAALRGEAGFAAHWAGQGAPLAREMPAARLVETLLNEWRLAERVAA